MPRAQHPACARILAVDSDGSMQLQLWSHLDRAGHAVAWVHDLVSARMLLRSQDFELVLLSTTLRDGSGLDLLADLHGRPALVVSADGSTDTLLDAFRWGADDYVTTPFSPEEVTARIGAVLRRAQTRQPVETIDIDALTIDLAAQSVTCEERPVDLTAKEFALLAFLAANPGRAFTREELLQSVWRSSSDWQQTSTITEHVRRIRQKLLAAGGKEWLHTIRGVGYRFDHRPAEDTSVRPELHVLRAS